MMKPKKSSVASCHNVFTYAVGNRVLNPDGCEPFAQFFNGIWGNEKITINVPECEAITAEQLNTHLKEQEKIKNLLSDLKQEILESGKEINPYGSLARCIEKIQTSSKIYIIDMNEINSRIKCDALKHNNK